MGERAMRTLPVVVAVAAIFAYAVADTSLTTMPLFSWSGKTAGVGEAKSAAGALAHSLKSGSPEIVMVYMLNEVSSNQMYHEKQSMTNLKNAVLNSKSSNFRALQLEKADTSSLLSTAREYGANTMEVKASELQDFLAKHTDLLSNAKPDVVIVNFPAKESMSSVDAVVGAIEKSISSTEARTSILSTTSEMKDNVASNLMTFYSSQNLWTQPATVQQALSMAASGATAPYLQPGGSNSPVSTRHSLLYGPSYYLTPTLLLAILVMIYIGVVALCAFCCILSLQTPEKFEGDMEREMSSALNEESK